MTRAFRWLAAVAGTLAMISPPVWVVALTATVATAIILARTSAYLRRRREAQRDPPSGTVALGRDAGGARVVLTDQQLSAHALILGATGAGKSTTLLAVLAEHVRCGRPVVAIDMKGSPAFARSLADAAASVRRPFRVWTFDGPGRWNPLAHGNPTELKDKLIASERFTEPHYQRAAERYDAWKAWTAQHGLVWEGVGLDIEPDARFYQQIMDKCWNPKRGAFTQYPGTDVLDAISLLMPLVGFIPPKDPLWLSTLSAMTDELVTDSLVYRYNPSASPDGLQGSEGTFSLCSFFFVDALARAGRLEEAQYAFEKMLTYANHVGLYSEEIDSSGRQIGNFPQAFTHLALIHAAIDLDAALNVGAGQVFQLPGGIGLPAS